MGCENKELAVGTDDFDPSNGMLENRIPYLLSNPTAGARPNAGSSEVLVNRR